MFSRSFLLGFILLGATAPPGCEYYSLNPAQNQTVQPETTATEAAQSPTASDSIQRNSASPQCETLRVDAPRGLACLHCMQPEAQDQSEVLIDILHATCLKNIAINYLVDGTFSFDKALLKRHIDLLSSAGRKPFLYFYLSNGATQRLWDKTTIDAFGTRIPPNEFRRRIITDSLLQIEFKRIVSRLIPVIRYAKQSGAQVSLVPMLEDNLSDDAFELLVELILDALPDDLVVSFGRNPCPGCYPGNEQGVPAGMFSELHTAYSGFDLQDGLVTNDGRDYRSSTESAGPTRPGLTLSELRSVRDQASRNNNSFILWSAKRQGLPRLLNSSPNKHPNQRDYPVPSPSEQREIVEFLGER